MCMTLCGLSLYIFARGLNTNVKRWGWFSMLSVCIMQLLLIYFCLRLHVCLWVHVSQNRMSFLVLRVQDSEARHGHAVCISSRILHHMQRWISDLASWFGTNWASNCSHCMITPVLSSLFFHHPCCWCMVRHLCTAVTGLHHNINKYLNKCTTIQELKPLACFIFRI